LFRRLRVHCLLPSFPTRRSSDLFKKLKKVLLDTDREQVELEIQSVKFFKQFVILKFKGIDNINDIEKYKGKSLLVPREDGVPLRSEEHTSELQSRFDLVCRLLLE